MQAQVEKTYNEAYAILATESPTKIILGAHLQESDGIRAGDFLQVPLVFHQQVMSLFFMPQFLLSSAEHGSFINLNETKHFLLKGCQDLGGLGKETADFFLLLLSSSLKK